MNVARRVGWRRLWGAIRSKNACKTCALGMGGQLGGMRNEAGHWPEICKKSLQAAAADMQDGIRDDFFQRYSLAQLRGLTSRELESLGRLVRPLYAGPDDAHYRVIDWDEAVSRVVRALKAAPPEQAFFYVSGRSSNEAGFLLHLLARLYGTNHVSNCSYYCHQASGVGLADSIGSGTATLTLEDVERADLFFLIGGNPASNHPRLMRTLMNIRRRGGRVVVVNPAREPGLVRFRVPSDARSLLFGSSIASLYVQPHVGGDLALLTGVAKAVAARGALDAAFIQSATTGWEKFRAHLEAIGWEQIESESGVDRATVERVAELYAAARGAVFGWTMGVTHHLHGVQNVQAIVNLALLRGMIGRPGAGLLPIRGHSNVQGIGSVGVTPKLRDTIFERLQSHFGVRLPTTPGLDTLSCIEQMEAGHIRSAWCLGGNLFGATPDQARTAAAFDKLDSVVYLSTTLNTGHAWGRANQTLILPAKARDEESQSTTQESMFNFVRLSDGGPPRLDGPRSEVEVIAALARGALGDDGPVDWRSMEQHRRIREAIAAIVPGYEAIGRIDESKQEFQIPGRVLHQPTFATQSGKARFHVTPIPHVERHAGALRLMTIRSEGQFNTVVYEDYDLYRQQDRRDVILMNADDIAALGLKADQRVTVRGPAGELREILVRPFDIRAGNAAMYYPEANALVPFAADGESRTPAFKSVWVKVTASSRVALATLKSER
jgi:molybdopterin-dependent oxidoreductase alpha subunit